MPTPTTRPCAAPSGHGSSPGTDQRRPLVVELEYNDRSTRRSKLYVAVGLVVALIVGGLVFALLRFGNLAPQGPAEVRQGVGGGRGGPPRKREAGEGGVPMRSVPADPTNESAFTRIDEVLGRLSGVPISTGQMVTRTMLASNASGQAFSIREPGQEYDPNGPPLRAVSVSVPDERAVAGTLVAGQRVDLIVTMAINPEIGQTAEEAALTTAEFIPGPSTKVTLQMLTVLSRNGTIYILRADLATAA